MRLLGPGAWVQDRSYSAHWLRTRDTAPPSGALTWVVLGDSAAVGVGAATIEDSYVSRIAQALTQQSGRPVHVVNLAVSGAKADDVLTRQVPQLADLAAPGIVTCVVGGNDVAWAGRFNAPRFEARISAIAAALPSGSTLGLVPRFGYWPYEGRVRRANVLIVAAAEAHGHSVADIHGVSATSWGERLSLLSGDYFHPNSQGYARWSQALLPHVRAQLARAAER